MLSERDSVTRRSGGELKAIAITPSKLFETKEARAPPRDARYNEAPREISHEDVAFISIILNRNKFPLSQFFNIR
jgi:hypothetical protein